MLVRNLHIFRACLLLIHPLAVHAVGYPALTNGFDLDRDGIMGELGVDDTICDDDDGTPSGNFYEEDLFGDASLERQVFVDCTSGTNNSTCGLPGTPCLTIDYAKNTRLSPPSGTEADIVCFTGTCTPNATTFSDSGVTAAGRWTRTKSGFEVIDFQFPAEPMMLVGWDKDDDNEYPPVDTGDVSVLDGQSETVLRPLDFGAGDAIETAHFKVRNYFATGGGTPYSYINVNDNDEIYIHDIEFSNVNVGIKTGTTRTFKMDGAFRWIAFERNFLNKVGGSYLWRGFVEHNPTLNPALDEGPVLVRHNTWIGEDSPVADQGFPDIWDVSGNIRRVYFIENDLDSDGSAWASPTDFHNIGWQIVNCANDFHVIGNKIAGMASVFSIDYGNGGFCNDTDPGRPTCDPCVFANNDIIMNAPVTGNRGIVWELTSHGNGFDDERSRDITIRNNFIYNELPGQMVRFFVDRRGDSDAGVDFGYVDIVGNTVVSTKTSNGNIPVFHLDGTGTSKPNVYNVVGNLFHIANTSNRMNVRLDWIPSTTWNMDFNAFDDAASYRGPGGLERETLALCVSDGVCGPNDVECDAPTFLGPGLETAAALHLGASDACAKDKGTSLAAWTLFDFDEDTRESPHDIGADDQAAGAGEPTQDFTLFRNLTLRNLDLN